MTQTVYNVDFDEQTRRMNSFQLENGNLFVNLNDISCDVGRLHKLGIGEKIVHPPTSGRVHSHCHSCMQSQHQRCDVQIPTPEGHFINCSVLRNKCFTIQDSNDVSSMSEARSDLSDPLISQSSLTSKKSNCSLCISIIGYLGFFLSGIGTVVGAVYVNNYFGIND